MTVGEAREQLAELERKASAHRVRAAAHETDIASISLAAQTGESGARKRLTGLIAETPAIEGEARSIQHAIMAARSALAGAEAADLDAAERNKASQAVALIEAYSRRGAALDMAFDAAIAELGALEHDFRALELLGYAPTTAALAKISMTFAAATKLQRVGLQQRFLAPGERRDFAGAIQGWAASVLRRAHARLERKAPSEAA